MRGMHTLSTLSVGVLSLVNVYLVDNSASILFYFKVIAAGILKSPFFQGERPISLNYGAVGVIIAHEFTHTLDDNGRKCDEKGNLHNWWSDEALNRFTNQSQCFVKQYAEIVDPITGLHVSLMAVEGNDITNHICPLIYQLNGRNTLDENIADNGGVRVAFKAFQSRQVQSGVSTRLAGLSKYTPEQLFFISYANVGVFLISSYLTHFLSLFGLDLLCQNATGSAKVLH